MTIRRWMIGAAALVLAVVGCGGKVLVDGLPTGDGGAGGLGSSSGTADGGFGMTCSNPPDPSKLTSCSGTAASTGSGGISCQTNWCDGNSNTYSAQCQGTVCHCLVNGNEKCTCVLNGPGMFCSGGVPDCCPWGKKAH